MSISSISLLDNLNTSSSLIFYQNTSWAASIAVAWFDRKLLTLDWGC